MSLTACLKKAHPYLSATHKATILAKASELRKSGLVGKDAALQAVQHVLSDVESRLTPLVRDSMRKPAEAPEPEGLTAPTKEDILAQQDRAEQGKKDEAAAGRESDQRNKADAERGDFALTGSDRAADANADQGAMFKRGDATNQDIRIKQVGIQQFVDKITGGWSNAPDVIVARDMNDPLIPQRVRDHNDQQLSKGADAQVHGFVYGGKVYLVADALRTKEHALTVLAHEALGHYGFKGLFGDRLDGIKRQVVLSRRADVDAKIKSYGLDPTSHADRMYAAEEVLAEMAQATPHASVVQRAIAAIRQWLRERGLNLKLTDNDIVNQFILPARDWVVRGRDSGSVEADPSFSRGTREEGLPHDVTSIHTAETTDKLKAHSDYKAAKSGDPQAAANIARDLVSDADIAKARDSFGPDAIYTAPLAEEASGKNAIPVMVAERYAAEAGGRTVTDIIQSNRAFHTGANAMERMIQRPLFDGPVEKGGKYVLVDDVSTMGGTLAELADHIRAGGGQVVGTVVLANTSRADTMVPSKQQINKIKARFGDAAIREIFHADPAALTAAEATYVLGFRDADALRARAASAARENAERLRSKGVRAQDVGDPPPFSRAGTADHTEADDDAVPVPKEREPYQGPGSKLVHASGDLIGRLKDDILMKAAPMSVGSDIARAVAKDYANAERLANYQWQRFDSILKKNYTESERTAMWEAGDDENLQRMREAEDPDYVRPEGSGLDALPAGPRKTMETLHEYGEALMKRAQDIGMFKGEGVPFWTPRMAAMIGENGEWARIPGEGPQASSDGRGRNIGTTASSLKQRKYLTSQETEAAADALAKSRGGKGAVLVKDIRTMPMAMAKMERAIAGRELIDQIKQLGEDTGIPTVSTSDKEGFFTEASHPAFQTFRAKPIEGPDGKWTVAVDQNGDPVIEKTPIFISKDFEGPLKAIMAEQSGETYKAVMSFKAKTMGLIMYSPLIHNAVEWGRALPVMPGKVLTFKVYFEGNAIKNDPQQMAQAIKDGLVPIGHRAQMQDITGLAEDPTLAPGRSWTAKLLGGAVGMVSEKGGEAVKKGVDAAGDFWHNTLLWDRVGDLQAGLYGNVRQDLIRKGLDEQTAGRIAAHFANRYAGALPNESMSANARKLANLVLFSRSFTLGNMGVMKDMFTGFPPDVAAQIKRDAGEMALRQGVSIAKRKAVAAFVLDVGLMYAGNALMQNAFDKMKRDKSLSEIQLAYLERLRKLVARTHESPLEVLTSPFQTLGGLTPGAENEPGKEDRIRYGKQEDGTNIYMRLPTGKVGEEFKGWTTSPLKTLANKEGTIFRPLMQTWNNDKGMGQRVYNPDDTSWAGIAKAAGNIAMNFMGQQLPLDSIKAAHEWANGTAHDVDKMKVWGPLVGLTFSKGSPGGPAVGEMYHEMKVHQGLVQDAMPDIREAIKEGNEAKAEKLLESLAMSASQILTIIKHQEDPESRLSPNALKKYNKIATPESQERMDKFRSE
jgi:hypothetical protein